MPLPESWTQVPITGTFLRADGSPNAGTLVFKRGAIVGVDGSLIGATNFSCRLDASGAIPAGFVLPATDDPDLPQRGWAYTVYEYIAGGRDPYKIVVPYDAGSIDLTAAPHTEGIGNAESPFLRKIDLGVDVASQVDLDEVRTMVEGVEGFATDAAVSAGAAISAKDAAEAARDEADAARLLGATIGYATKADMDADLAPADSTLALVTNDSTSANNGTYRKEGATGTGSWVKSADRVTALEGEVGTLTSRLLGEGIPAGTTAFLVPQTANLFNKADVVSGYTINGTTGELTANATTSVSNFILVEPSASYFVHATWFGRVAWYDEGLALISSTTTLGALTSPSNARFMRVVVQNAALDYAVVNAGTTSAGPAIPYRLGFSTASGYIPPSLGVVVGPKENLSFNTTAGQLEIVGATLRLLTAGTSYLLPATTLSFPSAGNYRLEYSPVTNAVSFVASSAAIGPQTVIFGTVVIGVSTITVANLGTYSIDNLSEEVAAEGQLVGDAQRINLDWTAGYLRITTDNTVRVQYGRSSYLLLAQDLALSITGWNRVVFNVVTQELEVIASNAAMADYQVSVAFLHTVSHAVIGLPPHYVNGAAEPATDLTDITTVERFVVNGPLDANYEAATLPSFDSAATANTSDIYALYDALVTAYPNYVSRTSLGLDDAGNTIYRYDFTPAAVYTDQPTRHFPKMILIGGVHGYEKVAAYSLYNALEAICSEWQSHASLETLRWHAHLIVVPIASPYAFDNDSRKNENGVNIARNFATGWTLVDPSSDDYGGAAALSEPSAQYIDAILSANDDAVYFGSFHNFDTPIDPDYFIWHASATQFGRDLAESLISRLSRSWKSRFAWFPQDDTTTFGYVSAAPGGSESRDAATVYGVQGGTFEICSSIAAAPDSTTYSSEVATLGKETIINWLLLNLKYGCDLYNSRAI